MGGSLTRDKELFQFLGDAEAVATDFERVLAQRPEIDWTPGDWRTARKITAPTRS